MELRRLRFLVVLAFATLLVKCDEIQRIYQNRLSTINGQVSIKPFEVLGLASVELEADSSGTRPTYFFDCNTTLNNGTGITWPYNGENPRFRIEPIPSSTNGKRFSTSDIRVSDLGVYTCLDTYTNSNVSINITRDNPAILPVNRVLRIMERTAAVLQVYVSGYPLVTSNQIHWYRPNGTEILESQALFEDGRRTMILSEVQSIDEGLYRCEVTTSYGNRSTLIQLDVYGQSPLRVYQGRIVLPVGAPVEVEVFPVQGLATVELVAGGPTYYLDCNTSRNDGSGITWRRMDGRNRFQVSDMVSTASKRLNLVRLNESDLGLYECFDNQSSAGDRATVNITTDNPAVSAINQTVETLEGGQALLEVYVSGYPLITGDHISWYWPNGSIIQEQEASFMNDGRTLFLVSVQLADAGVYHCEVTLPDSGGNRSALVQLKVHTKSFILSHPSPAVPALEWSNITLSCSASGVPLPNITWEKEGGATPYTAIILTTPGDTPNSVISVLKFNGIRYSDAGKYRCVADNNKTPLVSSDYAQVGVTPRLLVFINVSGEPHPFRESITVPEEADVILECYGSGDLQWTASNGQEIPTTDSESRNIYQIHVSSRDVQLLQIRNFSRNSNAAGYTCTTDLTTQIGASVEITVTLHGEEVTEDTRTEPKRDPESVAAIIGGIVVVIILAVMLVLFASVVLLIIIRRRAKYIVQISAMQTPEEARRSNGELSIASSLKEKPELSEGSVHTETKLSDGSIHTEASVGKQEQNGSSTNAGTGQMNDYL